MRFDMNNAFKNTSITQIDRSIREGKKEKPILRPLIINLPTLNGYLSEYLMEIDKQFNEHFGITDKGTCQQYASSKSIDLYTEDIDTETDSDGDGDNSVSVVQSNVTQYVNNKDSFPLGRNTEIDGAVAYDDNDVVDDDDDDDDEVVFNIGNGSEKSCNCMKQFDQLSVSDHVLSIKELSKHKKDMYIMGVMRPINESSCTKTGKRKMIRNNYTFQGKSVCRNCFKQIYDIGEKTLRSLKKHFEKNGPVPRQHGNIGRKPKHSLNYEDTKRVVDFIIGYSNDFGLPQPAAPRDVNNLPSIFLPCSDTKLNIFHIHEEACSNSNDRSVGLSSFKDIWLKCCPHIKISTPRDDVCQKCEIFRRRIQDATSDEDKLVSTSEFKIHLEKCQTERTVYATCIRESLDELHGVVRPPGVIPPVSTCYKKMHYTFDFSKNLTIPHSSRQMGPIYFVSPLKVFLFGVRLDGVPMQYNYLFDESQTIGEDGANSHGPNAVISMIHHSFHNFGYGEKECGIHADNCGGQNKNKYVMAYLCWRVMMGLHKQITYMMQIAGHARCLIDSGFAHVKKHYRRNDADTIQHVAQLVNKSSVSNTSVTYRNEDGSYQWRWFNWKTFFATDYKAIKGLQQYQHFRFTDEDPGVVYIKKEVGANEHRVVIYKRPLAQFDRNNQPTVMQASGLSTTRQNYLYKYVRPFVRPQFQDVTCPRPNEE